MSYKSLSYINHLIGIVILVAISMYADHDCIEEFKNGQIITINNPFPQKWLLVGNKSLADTTLHEELRLTHHKHYSVTKGAFNAGNFCALKDSVYISVSINDFGTSVDFSNVPPKCFECKPIEEDIGYLFSGTGLKIGQNKKDVEAKLGFSIKQNITSFEFEEIENNGKSKVLHTQTLRVEFHLNKLMRFTILDYRESYE